MKSEKSFWSFPTILGSISVFALVASTSVEADTVAQWTFETSFLATSVTSATIGPLAPEVVGFGSTGAATGSHAGATTVWSSPSGNASLKSLSANLWAQTSDYFQFAVTPAGGGYTYSGITISYDQNGSGTGPKTFSFSYSTDGTTFTPVGSDYALASGSTWATSGPTLASQESFDLTTVTALNTAPTWYFRITDDSPVTAGAVGGGNV